MIGQDTNLSLTIGQLAQLNPQIGMFIERQLISNYEDFLSVLYKDIDFTIGKIQENTELRQRDTEDRLTIEIRNMLIVMGYNATHDEKHIGHTDLLIRKGNFVWIGEAKIHSTYEYLWEGFQQLTTRYSVGADGQKQGGVIIYIFKHMANNIMEKWRSYLTAKLLPGFSTEACPHKDLAFFSEHTHDKSGLQFKVRHIPVLLDFNPKDKSGRARKS